MAAPEPPADLVQLVREWQESFSKEWEHAPVGDYSHPANVRHAKAEAALFTWAPALPRVPEGETDTRQYCSCLGTCRGPEGLGARWRCALGRTARSPEAAPAERPET